jgi:hypothetical protein
MGMGATNLITVFQKLIFTYTLVVILRICTRQLIMYPISSQPTGNKESYCWKPNTQKETSQVHHTDFPICSSKVTNYFYNLL